MFIHSEANKFKDEESFHSQSSANGVPKSQFTPCISGDARVASFVYTQGAPSRAHVANVIPRKPPPSALCVITMKTALTLTKFCLYMVTPEHNSRFGREAAVTDYWLDAAIYLRCKKLVRDFFFCLLRRMRLKIFVFSARKSSF